MKRRLPAICALLAFGCAGLSACGSSAKTNATDRPTTPHGTVNIVVWHPYPSALNLGPAFSSLIADFNRTHSGIHVTAQYVPGDNALQKLLVAIRGGAYPDVVKLYGAFAPNIATNPETVALNNLVSQDKALNWSDFWPSERVTATVGAKIIGIPAAVDDVALVYNKKLFEQAGVPVPSSRWTWTDLRNAAKRLTNPAQHQFGFVYPDSGSEDTVWKFDALLWQAGGQILTPDGKKAAFDSPAGINALTLLQQMTLADHSVYLESGNGNYLKLFDSGKIAMAFDEPEDLPNFQGVDYGVQVLPGDLNHQTVSGPDNWVLLNNGSARRQAATTFVTWLTSPKVAMRWSLATGELPIRGSQTKLPEYRTFIRRYPGADGFVRNEQNAIQARPGIVSYPQISQAMGQAVASVLLGKSTPQAALAQAATQVNSALSAPQ